ncbi:MAG: hypothetical protein GY847_08485 [Proteobacteria bacterium]|nr:hypothetical protein [Pseudomonadota bacterium]
MLIIGIDENGLGPLLGPLVVTGVAFEVPWYDRETIWRVAREHLSADDSKKLFSRARLKTAEDATLSWLDVFGISPDTHFELADRILVSITSRLPCSPNVPDHCRPSSISLPVWTDCYSPDKAKCGRASLDNAGVTPTAVRMLSICPGAFNAATADPRMNKLRLDFHLMMQLVKELTQGYQGDVSVLCGKIGSTQRYGTWLDMEKIGMWSTEVESREVSTYKVGKKSRISFIKDADALHLPVAVSSMIGKYVRELSMLDLNQLLAEKNMRPASGYRDRVTAEFVAKTAKRRLEIGLSDKCFTRNS